MLFWGESKLLNFWTEIVKPNTLSVMRQNFAAIGRRTSKISWQKNKETAVKHKAFPNYRSGRPKSSKKIVK